MHPGFKIQVIFHERFANPISKRVHSTSLFIRFASLVGNISCILNSVCIKICIPYIKECCCFSLKFYFIFIEMTSISFAMLRHQNSSRS